MDDGIEREYRRRRGVPAAHLTLVAAAVLVVVSALKATTLSGTSPWDIVTPVIWLGLGGRVVLEQWRARTSVTAAGITVRGLLRTRTWAWSEVYDIRVEGTKRGTSRWPAYLYGTDGRRVLLPHIDEHQLADPIAEVEGLCATAVGAGLMRRETRPETEERILRGARRRTAGNRAVLGALTVAVAMFALDIWMIFTDRPTHSVLLMVCVPLLCLPLFFLALDRIGEVLAARRSPAPS
ncbi:MULTISPECIES: PH domain-containing protein [Streptomyces]|uniref:PH domain-containing protein n=2 Tax=Streptomyces TaxID=1883 RepID=A0ABV9IWB8_9ACTN